MLVDFGEGKGKLVVSQFLTKGRLAAYGESKGMYDIRNASVCCQFVLNMIEAVASEK